MLSSMSVFPWTLIVPELKKKTCTLNGRIPGRHGSCAGYILVTCWYQREEETTDPYIHTSTTTAEACMPFSLPAFWWQILVLTCSQSIHTEWKASSTACILNRVCVCVSVSDQYDGTQVILQWSPITIGNSQRPEAGMLHVNRPSKWFCHSTHSVAFGYADMLHWGVPVSYSWGDGGF